MSQVEQDRQKRRNQMRGRIMRAAMRLFLNHGFDGITIRKIASTIGYSPGAVYRYFEDKDHIFFALRSEGFERFYKLQLRARRSQSAKDRLREHAAAYIDFALQHSKYYELMFLMPAPMNRVVDDREWLQSIKSLDLLRDDVQQAIDEGSIRAANPEATVLGLWSTLHGVVTLLLRGRLRHICDASQRDIAQTVTDFVLGHILTERTKKVKPTASEASQKGDT